MTSINFFGNNSSNSLKNSFNKFQQYESEHVQLRNKPGQNNAQITELEPRIMLAQANQFKGSGGRLG